MSTYKVKELSNWPVIQITHVQCYIKSQDPFDGNLNHHDIYNYLWQIIDNNFLIVYHQKLGA